MKPFIVVQGPVATRSGYGNHTRDLVTALINADKYDFVTNNNKSVDIKTASLPFHKRIMIPSSQFRVRKDFYVGVKLNFKNSSGRNIDPMNIYDCSICGYIDRNVMENQPTQYFGEGYCKAYPLKNLKPIDSLIKLFKQ